MAGWLGRRVRSVWTWLLAVPLLVIAVQGYAYLELRAARTAAEADEPATAQAKLDHVLAIPPWNRAPGALLLQSRLQRQRGELEASFATLRLARAAAGSTTAELTFEWALLQAADGNVTEIAEYLQREGEASIQNQRLVWESLITGFLATYRANDAYTVAQQWLLQLPDDLRAKEMRGLSAVAGRGRGLRLGTDDLREVLKRDPNRPRTRLSYAVALYDLGEYADAMTEFRRLMAEPSPDADLRVRYARCLKLTGDSAAASAELDAVLAADDAHGLALRTRGQFALGDGQPKEALAWLARAAAAMSTDYQTQYLYFQALEQDGQAEAAATQLAFSDEVKIRAVAMAELRTRKLAERPLDPALSVEMATLLQANGQDKQAVNWLTVALSYDPSYRPAHEMLLKHYERTGNAAQAEVHRRALR